MVNPLANDARHSDALQLLLGYLNFSEGRPDARFQKTLAEVYARLVDAEVKQPWAELGRQLRAKLAELQASGSSAFQNVRQAEAVLQAVFDEVLPAYRTHHADLLFHLSDEDLFQPFFLARVAETVLAQGPTREDRQELLAAVLRQLNDYMGHRPIAVLESRPRGEPYAHERVRPVPIYIKDAGVAPGRYHEVVIKALEILRDTSPAILAEAFLDLDRLDELAFDPRAYDHAHPVNRRPNYVFGEWDPHLIDNKGHYRRFVVRHISLEAMLSRLTQTDHLPAEELLFEAGAVLAGIMLMASGISGSGPETHDSTVTLAGLIPRIARCRDSFYTSLLERVSGRHGERLRQEAQVTRQPFGGARQHLNHFLARHRAAQLQQRHLALLMAELGYAEASRRQATRIPAASVRMLSEIHLRLTAGQGHLEAGRLEDAARLLPEIEDLLHRGIECGAFADPWNVLGFAGLFPLFHAAEDSVRDTRVDELVAVVEGILNLYARVLSESAAVGEQALAQKLTSDLKRLAVWWDRFATYEVNEVRRVHGGEAAASAEHVAQALRLWHQRGERPADMGFWRDHLEGFRSAKAYALVVDTLLRKEDFLAAQGLLMHWLSQLDQVPLEDGEYSFHLLALRWMLSVCRKIQKDRQETNQAGEQPPAIVVKFFDYLEANAEDYWNVPQLELLGIPLEEFDEEEAILEEEGELFEAAYENMTYEDSTDDEIEAEVLEVGPQQVFDLEFEAERIEIHLRFLDTIARLWNLAVRLTCDRPQQGESRGANDPLKAWFQQAKNNYQELLYLLDSIYEHPIPDPLGGHEALVEFDRRRVIKDRLLHMIIGTSLDTWLAMMGLRGRRAPWPADGDWKATLGRLEESLWRGDAATARVDLPRFLEQFRQEPLLYTPLTSGGHPRQILRASRAQTLLRALAANLPRLGLIHETLLVIQAVQEMESLQPLQGPRVTEFDRLFQMACHAAVEAVVEAASAGPETTPDERLVALLERLIQPYLPLWARHSQTLRVAMLETVSNEAEWHALQNFIKRYGHELFHIRFMSMGNLRGILHQGVSNYLDYLEDQADPLHPIPLLDALNRDISRADAERCLALILQTLIENYDIYKDYNSTSPQSDYGENLYILFDFLRLKARYERRAWLFRPLVHVHEVLARHRPSAAVLWQEQFRKATQGLAGQHLEQLAELERFHGIRLNTVRDRLEERFVQTLALDRLCALIEPALQAAHTPDADRALAAFEEQLRPYAEHPTGVGLDVPHWLQRLGVTVHQARASRSAIAGLAENLLQIPRVPVSIAELEQQLVQTVSGNAPISLWAALIEALGQG